MADDYSKRTVDCIYSSALEGDFLRSTTDILNSFGYTDIVIFADEPERNGKGEKELEFNSLNFKYNSQSNYISKSTSNSKYDSVKFHTCFEIVSENPHEIGNLLRRNRDKFDLLCVRSNKEKAIRAAVEDRKNDILIPSVYDQPGLINQVVAKAARDNDVAFGFEMLPLFGLKGYKRVKYIEYIRLMLPSLIKYDVPLIFMTAAKSQHDLRDPISLSSFGFLLDFDIPESKRCLSSLARIIDENENRKTGVTPFEGITVVSEE